MSAKKLGVQKTLILPTSVPHPIHEAAVRLLLEQGGYTKAEVSGAWRDEDGAIVYDESLEYRFTGISAYHVAYTLFGLGCEEDAIYYTEGGRAYVLYNPKPKPKWQDIKVGTVLEFLGNNSNYGTRVPAVGGKAVVIEVGDTVIQMAFNLFDGSPSPRHSFTELLFFASWRPTGETININKVRSTYDEARKQLEAFGLA